MSDTQVILHRIAALRQRLDQAQGLVEDASATVALLEQETSDPVEKLGNRVAVGAWHNTLIEESINELPGAAPPVREPMPAPRRLTPRALQLLQRGRDLLHELRKLADDPLVQSNPSNALAELYHETAAMLDTVLRIVQIFPEAPSAQVRLCDGLESVLSVVGDRLQILLSSLQPRRRQIEQIQKLTDLYQALVHGKQAQLEPFQALALEIQEEAKRRLPMRFLHSSPNHPTRFIACHGLTTAQVIARVLLDDVEWKDRLHEPILAALLHDVGMVRVPGEILAHSGPLNDEQRRRMESHTREGAGILVPLAPGAPWLIEAAAGHHERSDGTGYPAGLIEMQMSPLVRLVTVCDIYAALCCPRPYRGALEPRTALTDTLLLADQGALDKFQAERLLNLSFYPVGSVVELSDGSTAVVVAAHCGNAAKVDPARPIVALLTDAEGLPAPAPCLIDLAQTDSRTVLRRLLVSERRELVGNRYPILV